MAQGYLYETLEKSGYAYVHFVPDSEIHLLRDIETGQVEAWFASKNHAGYGIIWRNTHLEFARDATKEEVKRYGGRTQ